MRANDFTADELVDLLGRVVAALHDQRVSPMEVLGDLLHEEVLQALGFGDDGPASALVRGLRAFRRAAQAEIDAVLRGRDPDEAVLASAWTYPLGCTPERAAAEAVAFRRRFGMWPRATARSAVRAQPYWWFLAPRLAGWNPRRPSAEELVTEAKLEELSISDPDGLLGLIKAGTLRPTLLTFAAEHAGRIPDSLKVVAVLLPLLDHPKAYVREGVLYGLRRHRTPDVCSRLERLLSDEPVEEIREIASEILAEDSV